MGRNRKLMLPRTRFQSGNHVNLNITFKSIIDLEEKKNVLVITVKGNPETIYRIATVPKAMQILKRMIIMSCSAYRLSAYFMSPASGVVSWLLMHNGRKEPLQSLKQVSGL